MIRMTIAALGWELYTDVEKEKQKEADQARLAARPQNDNDYSGAADSWDSDGGGDGD